jgi:hypothetical protein
MQPLDCSRGDFMKGRFIFGTAPLVILVAALFYFYDGSQAPSGQPALESVTAQNVADIKTQFNLAKHDARVLLLLSPT